MSAAHRSSPRAPRWCRTAGLVAAGWLGLACGRPAFGDGNEQRAGLTPAATERRMERYAWLASNSGPKGCPMELIAGDFYLPGGGSLYIPKAGVHAGWGREVSLHLVGEDKKPLPDSLEVAFFSWLEDRLYHGRFALPRDSIERLFREGAKGGPGHEAFRTLVAGVAPGGAVAVWASGPERQVEVFFGQATPSDANWHQVMGMPPTVDRRALVASTLADEATRDSLVRPMMQDPPPAGRWAGYRTQYRWRPAFDGIGRPERLDRVEFVNGERDQVATGPAAPGSAAPGSPATRPAPRAVVFTDPATRRNYWLTFDAEEITAAFARAGAGGQPFELVFAAPAAGATDVQVLVRGAGGAVPLRQVAREAYGGR